MIIILFDFFCLIWVIWLSLHLTRHLYFLGTLRQRYTPKSIACVPLRSRFGSHLEMLRHTVVANTLISFLLSLGLSDISHFDCLREISRSAWLLCVVVFALRCD